MIHSYPKLGFVVEADTPEQANFYRDQVLILQKEGKTYSEIKGLYPVTFADEPINTPIIEVQADDEPKKTVKKTEKPTDESINIKDFETDFVKN